MSDQSTVTTRNIAILLDGTGNRYSGKNSNLIKLMSVLKADETQLLYYSSGIGTVLPVGTSSWSRLKGATVRAIDMGLAWNFEEFVCDAYAFLMDYYQAGDKIYLFGFSRGAYTARALAGMIQRVGLLHQGNHNQIRLAYDVYKGPKQVTNRYGVQTDPAVLYRRIFGRSRLVSIEFVGVWDSVSSLGVCRALPRRQTNSSRGGFSLPQLPFAAGSRFVRYFRQALALDERRARFTPEYWWTDDEHLRLEKEIADVQDIIEQMPEHTRSQTAMRSTLPDLLVRIERDYPFRDPETGMITNLEVWFMGCHSDVGGGNDVNGYASLSNIPFRWMLREAVRCGILLDASGVSLLPALRIPAHVHHTIDTTVQCLLQRLRRVLTEQSADAKLELAHHHEVKAYCASISQEALGHVVEGLARLDARTPFDLCPDATRPVKESMKLSWWPLELLPLQTRDYTAKGFRTENKLRVNRGRGRQIVPGQKIHKSVLNRIVHDEQAGSALDARHRYAHPAAKVAQGMVSWAGVKEGRRSESDVWEE